jgi:acyl-coenzyme A thioesterase PaaI-like protein
MLADVDARLTETMRAAMPFAAALDIEGLSAGDGVVVARMAWAPGRCTAGGVLHGGAQAILYE